MSAKKQKSLRLSKETLRILSPSELRQADGAFGQGIHQATGPDCLSGNVATVCAPTCVTCTPYQGG
jgi:hypothetical protein